MTAAFIFLAGVIVGAASVAAIYLSGDVLIGVLDWFADEHDVFIVEKSDPLA